MKKVALLFSIIVLASGISLAQTSAFTYQGRLTDAGAPANGNYDLQFALFDNLAGGAQVGATQTVNAVAVSAGVFTVSLDFGANAFPGANRFLEIGVRTAGGGAFTVLAPRQPISSTPYAIRSANATTADTATTATNATNATNATTATNATQLGGVAANQYVVTSDSRLTDSRAPTPGSSNYVQNTTATQASSNFNISGNGTAGGTLSGNIVNATTQYNIGGIRILGNPGTFNLFAGAGAGQANTTGGFNSFFGRAAGEANTTGDSNSFFGSLAGQANTTGRSNSFFGRAAGGANTTGNTNSFFGQDAGRENTEGNFNSFFGISAGHANTTGSYNSFFAAGSSNTTGVSNSFFGSAAGLVNTTGGYNSFFGQGAGRNNTTGGSNSFFGVTAGVQNTTGFDNSFFGRSAGYANTTGSNNTIIGTLADVGSGNLNNATALGAGAVVSTSNSVVLGRSLDTVQIPGSLNVVGNLTGNFTVPAGNITGILSPANGGSGLNSPGASGNFLRSNGTSWTSSLLQASDIPSGSTNYIQNIPGIGQQSASFNITGGGTANIFNAATQYNIGGSRVLSVGGTDNVFAGVGAGGANKTGFENSFFGRDAGRDNTEGGANSFFGSFAGRNNTVGVSNSFFGHSAGFGNTTGAYNSFFGREAGDPNTTGFYNSFFGTTVGQSNTTGGANSFFGHSAGNANTTGSQNTIIGDNADVGSGNLSNATAIGASAVVSQSNSLVLGNGVNVGIGTTAPAFKLQVIDSSNTGLRVQTNIVGGTVASFGGNGDFYVDAPSYVGGRLTILENGNVGINVNNPVNKLDVAGIIAVWDLGSAGATPLCQNASLQISYCSSSIRYKQNINPFNPGLSLIKQLRPVSFNWRANNQPDLGLVAEDVAKVEPLLTTTNNKGEIEGVKYDRVGVVLVNAVQEQQTQIESLEKQNQAQQKQIDEQKKLIEALRVLVCSQNPAVEICKPNN